MFKIYNIQDSSENIKAFKIILNKSKKYKKISKRNKYCLKKFNDAICNWKYLNKITKLLKINWSKLMQ
jgi:hypothetical protein